MFSFLNSDNLEIHGSENKCTAEKFLSFHSATLNNSCNHKKFRVENHLVYSKSRNEFLEAKNSLLSQRYHSPETKAKWLKALA